VGEGPFDVVVVVVVAVVVVEGMGSAKPVRSVQAVSLRRCYQSIRCSGKM
jgi:hypothetical protein